jgi:hypothetical protein
MWRCPNCGEQIEPEFEVCWKCGTAQDGTRTEDFLAEANDPAGPDRGPDPEPAQESAEDVAAAKARHERIVELCSAATAFEAQEICNVLQEGGIQARVVGDALASAAGGLVMGEPIAPRVWVLASEAGRARELLARRFAESAEEFADWPESEGKPQWEVSGEPEEAELPSDRRFRFLSQGFWIVALACVAVGSTWAWKNGATISEHPATALGRLVDHSYYTYTVGGETYDAAAGNARYAPVTVTIHYDPHNPEKHIVGNIAPPWVVLAFAFGLAAFLAFVGYQFR